IFSGEPGVGFVANTMVPNRMLAHLGGSGLGRLSLATESQDCTSGAKAGQQHAFVCVHGFLLIMKTSVSSSGRHLPIQQDFMAYPPFFPAGAENNNPAKRCQLKISLN
ncbi:hypothetical protein GUA89_28550, partial [Escherichia coli]|nr:hypothetical protein [Escherichia coli]